MLLKRLEAYGFKSFADKLEVEFGEGVTAIVGPNGSGKSNITDAIRWVLGEQNVRSLRGSKAEDIIFTGSSTRRALGAAEVSVTFDNSDGKLPLDFQEIMITRRIFRTGESEFLINKTKCRLKDIYNLFADTGLGKNSISVISQNKVDEVLNTKPEDRRYFFEECAGITKYRDRKKEATRKLEATDKNVVRLHDIVTEIEKQLLPLQEQAEKTKRYNSLSEHYEACKLTEILFKYEHLIAENNRFLDEIKTYEVERSSLEATVTVSETEKLTKHSEITKLEKELSQLSAQRNELQTTLQQKRNRATMLQERLTQTVHSQQLLEDQQQEQSDNHKLDEESLKELRHKSELANLTATRLAEQLQQIEEEIKGIETAIDEQKDKIKQRQQLEADKRQQIEQQTARLMEIERQLSDIKGHIEAQQAAHSQLVEDSIQKHSEREELVSTLQTTRAQAEKKREGISSQETELSKLSALCAEDMEKIAGLKHNIKFYDEKIKFFAEMQNSYEGFGKSAKRILQATEPWRKQIYGAVAELIEVDEPFAVAIEIALGNAMQNIVTKDAETAKAAIAYLKQHQYGRVTFMPLTTVQSHQNKRIEVEVGKYGFIAYADELVNIDPMYRVITQSLLGRIAVVDTIDNALKLAKLNDYRLRIVTLAGELLQPGGAITGGSTHNKDSGFLQRANQLTELKAALTEERKELREVNERFTRNESNRKALAEHINLLQQEWQKLNLAITQYEFAQENIRNWFSNTEQQQEAIKQRIAGLNVKLVAIEENRDEQQATIGLIKQELSKDIDYTEINTAIGELEEQLKLKRQESTRKQISCSEAQQELFHNDEKQRMLAEQIKRYQDFLRDSKQEIANFQKIIDDSVQESKLIETDTVELLGREKQLKSEHEQLYKRILGMRSDLEDMDAERSKITAKVNAIKDKIHKVELNSTKLEAEIKQCVTMLQEDHKLTPEAALTRRLEISAGELKKELKKLEQEIQEIGPVNPHAINEYEALNERFTFMSQQIEDLLKAKADLQTIIEEIDKTMATQFSSAFERIKVSFNSIFQRLFGGGKATLRLTDKQDILNTGIEIEVEPPDKKPLSMASLSGGERTLTVIALLFAFFSYNPAPFSVLDEIDAPLDEANVKRFAKFLRDYAKNTQFILVTHRRGTMEAADIMYGVTIEDAGVSKLISVKLDEVEERG